MPYGQFVGKAITAFATGVVGAGELAIKGVYNYGVRLAGGFASVPFLLDSVDAAVAVQQGFKDRLGYEMRSSGAQAIGQGLQPFAQGFQDNVATPLYGSIGVPGSLDSLVPIRITTVTDEMSARVQGKDYLDPLSNTYKAAPAGETIAVDHIFPSVEIVQLPYFNTLTKSQMTSII